MKSKILIICIIILVLVIGVLLFLVNRNNNQEENNNLNDNISDENTLQIESNNTGNIEKSQNGEYSMKVVINNKEYDVELNINDTSKDILSNLPLNLTMQRYAGHEYYSELPFTPKFDANRTSNIKSGEIYYWDGWNAFVINFEDYDISPYKVVHIGKILDDNISELLSNSEDKIEIKVNN